MKKDLKKDLIKDESLWSKSQVESQVTCPDKFQVSSRVQVLAFSDLSRTRDRVI
jgi:hypothetical protein